MGIISYQRFISRSMNDETFRRRAKAIFASNVVGVFGGSLGAAIGNLLGNIVAPGIGGYVGSIIGGTLLGVSSSLITDYLIDP
jgi:outer membrane lipoprotein SlyB